MSDAKPKDIATERTPGGWRYPVSQTNAPGFLTGRLYDINSALSPEERFDGHSVFEALAAQLVARVDRVKSILRAAGCSGNLDIEYDYREALESVMHDLGYRSRKKFLKLTDNQICGRIEEAFAQGKLKAVVSQVEPSAEPAKDERGAQISRVRRKNPKLARIIKAAQQAVGAASTQSEACKDLAQRGVPTPPGCDWGGLLWDKAYRDSKYRGNVKKWLSDNAPMH